MSGSYHIAADSCTDHDVLKDNENVNYVPLILSVDGKEIFDDESFDQQDFLEKIAHSKNGGKSACPSPFAFAQAYGDDDEDAYGITLSSKVSGSYSSAKVAADLVQQERPNKKIHVFDSKSAACGQTLILLKLKECLKNGFSFDKTVNTVEKYISEMSTVFVLQDLSAFQKSGRISHLEGFLGGMLNIKPVLGSTPEGAIKKVGIGRGTRQAMKKLVDYIGETVIDPASKTLGITYCNCKARAEELCDEIMARYPFKDSILLAAAGVSTLYAADGGIVVAY